MENCSLSKTTTYWLPIVYGRTPRLLIIRTLRSAVYSLEVVDEVLDEMDQHSISHAKKIASDALQHMDYTIQQQLRAGYYLYKLCEFLKREPTQLENLANRQAFSD